MTEAEFEQAVAKALDAIPERFLKRLKNVAVVTADDPSPAQRKKLMLRDDWTLFGLYEGVPQVSRGAGYTFVLPDKITIFKNPIESAARTPEELIRLITDTVWHEIAHHFGMDEHEVQHAEVKRGRRVKKI